MPLHLVLSPPGSLTECIDVRFAPEESFQCHLWHSLAVRAITARAAGATFTAIRTVRLFSAGEERLEQFWRNVEELAARQGEGYCSLSQLPHIFFALKFKNKRRAAQFFAPENQSFSHPGGREGCGSGGRTTGSSRAQVRCSMRECHDLSTPKATTNYNDFFCRRHSCHGYIYSQRELVSRRHRMGSDRKKALKPHDWFGQRLIDL